MALVFLNIDKAFDKVWHEGYQFKLSAVNLLTKIVKIVESFLSNCTFKIKIKECFSNTRQTFMGVSQGSYIAPTLYLTYINNLTTTPKPNFPCLSKIPRFSSKTKTLNVQPFN